MSRPPAYAMRREALWPALVLAAGFAVKTAAWRSFANPAGGFFFDSPDSYDHLRRIELLARQFPSLALHDFYAGYPAGTGHVWAPLFDYLFAAVAAALGLARPAVETLCFFSGPVLFAALGAIVFALARRLSGSFAGALAAAAAATFHPALVSHSLPSNFDHHVLELILCLLFLALPLLERESRLPPPRLAAAAGLVAGSVFLWRGAHLFWLFAFAAALLRAALGNDRRLAAAHASVFLASSALLALYCLSDPLGLARGVSFVLISWFQPLLLAGFAAVLAFVAFAPRRALAPAAAAATLGVLALAAAPPAALRSRLAEAAQFAFGAGDPWLGGIDELRGTFTAYGFLDGVGYLTPAYFLIPAAAVAGIAAWRRDRGGGTLPLQYAAWSPLAALAVVYRYAPYGALLASLATALLIAEARRRTRGITRSLATALLVAAALGTSLEITGETLRNAPIPQVDRGLLGPRGTATWIRRNTPPTSHYLDAAGAPEYGILADWDLGSFLYYAAERPAVATPFGWETHGLYEQAAFFAAQSPEQAQAVAAANRVRYVLTSEGRDPRVNRAIAESGAGRGRLPPDWVAQRFAAADSAYYRLHVQDGSGYRLPDGYREASGSFRLVHESDLAGERRTPEGFPHGWYKLFEIVPGARIEGTARPSTAVELSLALTTGRGRRLVYRDLASSDAQGRFGFRVPYATGVRQGDVLAAPAYAIRAASGERFTASVSDGQAREGAAVGALSMGPAVSAP